jgi:hypothetical protein
VEKIATFQASGRFFVEKITTNQWQGGFFVEKITTLLEQEVIFSVGIDSRSWIVVFRLRIGVGCFQTPGSSVGGAHLIRQLVFAHEAQQFRQESSGP